MAAQCVQTLTTECEAVIPTDVQTVTVVCGTVVPADVQTVTAVWGTRSQPTLKLLQNQIE